MGTILQEQALDVDVRKMATRTRPKLTSRAVARPIEAGNSAVCAHCDEPVKFKARDRGDQVIANVYVRGVWDRVEHYHLECYGEAGEPYGTPAESASFARSVKRTA
jgi:hypothetical protein